MNISNLNTNDIIDVRELIERVEKLRQEREDAETVGDWESSDECGELAFLESVLSDLEGNGGDEQWEGSWYPATLICDDHFEDYARELAEDVCSDAVSNASWPLTCIDWARAAQELQLDYTSTEIDGVTYWYR